MRFIGMLWLLAVMLNPAFGAEAIEAQEMVVKNESNWNLLIHPLTEVPTKFDPKNLDPGQSVAVLRPKGEVCRVIVMPTILDEIRYPCAAIVIIKNEHIEWMRKLKNLLDK